MDIPSGASTSSDVSEPGDEIYDVLYLPISSNHSDIKNNQLYIDLEYVNTEIMKLEKRQKITPTPSKSIQSELIELPGSADYMVDLSFASSSNIISTRNVFFVLKEINEEEKPFHEKFNVPVLGKYLQKAINDQLSLKQKNDQINYETQTENPILVTEDNFQTPKTLLETQTKRSAEGAAEKPTQAVEDNFETPKTLLETQTKRSAECAAEKPTQVVEDNFEIPKTLLDLGADLLSKILSLLMINDWTELKMVNQISQNICDNLISNQTMIDFRIQLPFEVKQTETIIITIEKQWSVFIYSLEKMTINKRLVILKIDTTKSIDNTCGDMFRACQLIHQHYKQCKTLQLIFNSKCEFGKSFCMLQSKLKLEGGYPDLDNEDDWIKQLFTNETHKVYETLNNCVALWNQNGREQIPIIFEIIVFNHNSQKTVYQSVWQYGSWNNKYNHKFIICNATNNESDQSSSSSESSIGDSWDLLVDDEECD